MSLKATLKGWIGEVGTSFCQWVYLDSKIYPRINNATIPTPDGTTQIDHIIVSKYGIFVIETKNMEGWIFGNEKDPTWTQSIYGKKYKFQNPLRQNYKHTKSLSDFLEIEHEKLFSIIMFWGGCEFKTPMPPNVMNHGFTSYIKSKQEILFSDNEVQDIVKAINEGKLPRTWATRKKHVESLNERFSNTNTCPKCGGELVLRVKKSSSNKGSEFYGCKNFPSCRYIKNIDPP